MATKSATQSRLKQELEELRSMQEGGKDIHLHPSQISRQRKALEKKYTPIEIDKVTQFALFKGSGKEPYITTLTSCTCRDFILRKFPCKHIYRLAHELGEFSLDDIPKKPEPKNQLKKIDKKITRQGKFKEEIENLKKMAESDLNIHNHPAQRRRREKALRNEYIPISIDKDQQSATFQGSDEKVYITTMESCSCKDFSLRGFPCKHMYRLAHELGLFDIKKGSNLLLDSICSQKP